MRHDQSGVKKAFGLLEYVVLMVIVLTVMVYFRGYLQRALQGQYRKVGETIGFLRQYSPRATIDCAYDDMLHLWYSQACFDNELLKAGCKRSTQFNTCADNVRTACQAACSGQP